MADRKSDSVQPWELYSSNVGTELFLLAQAETKQTQSMHIAASSGKGRVFE
jgi:hypothetical protein